jgi:hypothetical protein
VTLPVTISRVFRNCLCQIDQHASFSSSFSLMPSQMRLERRYTSQYTHLLKKMNETWRYSSCLLRPSLSLIAVWWFIYPLSKTEVDSFNYIKTYFMTSFYFKEILLYYFILWLLIFVGVFNHMKCHCVLELTITSSFWKKLTSLIIRLDLWLIFHFITFSRYSLLVLLFWL